MAKVIAIMNEKGGTGKSTTTTTLAYLLAKQGEKTLAVCNCKTSRTPPCSDNWSKI